MSLYNTLFGVNPLSKMILASLDLTIEKVPRFRDCYIAAYRDTDAGGEHRWIFRDVSLDPRDILAWAYVPVPAEPGEQIHAHT